MSNNIIKFLWRCQEAYHRGEPLISDDEFDALAEQYNFYEVGYTPTKKAKHTHRMYSLQKIYTDDNKNPLPEDASIVITPKLDGSAISLYYVKGILSGALTRGNGEEGENIEDKFELSDIIPKVINARDEIIQVMGEVIAPKTIPNARNYVSGALHLKDPNEFLEKELTFVAYDVKPHFTNSYVADLNILKDNGFNVVTQGDWSDFPQDGKVVRVTDNELYESLGYTAKHPRGAYALKDKADVEIKESELLEVRWQVGKNGKVTPVAILEEIIIGGANISRATLHNPGFIESLDLSIGDTLLITRSGGIIPKVVGKI